MRTALVATMLACRSDVDPDRSPTDAALLPSVEVEPVRGVAGLEDLACDGPGLLKWSRDGVDAAPATVGRAVVPAREAGPGTWTCTAPDGDATAVEVELAAERGNVLLVVIDDVGIDRIGLYGVPGTHPPTPTIDSLAAQGLRFTTAWALPECSPTRASLLTGRYPRRTLLGSVPHPQGDDAMALSEVTIPEAIEAAGYTSSLAGKWHLSPQRLDRTTEPAEQGFHDHRGSISNLEARVVDPKAPITENLGYYRWQKDNNGALSIVTTYATVDTTDDAIGAAQTMPEPWFLMVSYNAAHSPFHLPPTALVTQPVAADESQAFDLAIEAVDAELGRLLATMDPSLLARTTLLLVSDNGTPHEVLDPTLDPNQSKGHWLEGATRVPMVVTGPLVAEPGSVCDAYVNVVDVLPTIAAIAGASLDDGVVRDGSSLLPYLADPVYPSARSTLWSEKFVPNGPGPYVAEFRVVRDATHTLVLGFGLELLYRRGPGELEATELLISEAPLDEADVRALADLRLALQTQEAAFGISPLLR